jgi:hypothetical protein
MAGASGRLARGEAHLLGQPPAQRRRAVGFRGSEYRQIARGQREGDEAEGDDAHGDRDLLPGREVAAAGVGLQAGEAHVQAVEHEPEDHQDRGEEQPARAAAHVWHGQQRQRRQHAEGQLRPVEPGLGARHEQ